MATATHDRLTAEQFLALDDPDQRLRFAELIDGVIVVTAPSAFHQELEFRVIRALRNWMDAAPGRGQAGLPGNLVVDEHNVFEPDVWWMAEHRKPGLDWLCFPDNPDLVVEVRSPSTWRYDVHVKKRRYEEIGVAELWLVDTDAEVVLVFRRSADDKGERSADFDVALELQASEGDCLTSPLLDGFSLDLVALFDQQT
jgi:Uma2 family endonuclease